MEKFEFEEEKNLEIFSGFVGKAKDVLTTLIDNIKENIKNYEQKIEDTTKEIEDNETSREKCEHEITKMENKIDEIKDAIENVESTYKRIADAYSSTSKGETKELYSEIIDGAKANCEKDVEKNRSEIARLNSDIEAIKNNIAEFTKIIDELNRDLENYNLELFKYNKALEYMEKTADKTNEDLEDISNKKEPAVKKAETKTTKKAAEVKRPVSKSTTDDTKETTTRNSSKSSIFDIETETFETAKEEKKEPEKVEPKTETKKEDSYEDTLKQIYDLTGYKPKEEKEPTPEVKEEPKEEKKTYTDNLENLFTAEAPKKDVPFVEPTIERKPIMDTEFSTWEEMLNAPTKEEPKAESKSDNGIEDTVNQLLTPYGTTYERLSKLVNKEYIDKNGKISNFNLTREDVIKAINSIDGNDLKKMKTVGPEITLLRKVKEMKEGNL